MNKSLIPLIAAAAIFTFGSAQAADHAKAAPADAKAAKAAPAEAKVAKKEVKKAEKK